MDKVIERVLFTEEQIKSRVAELGRQLCRSLGWPQKNSHTWDEP